MDKKHNIFISRTVDLSGRAVVADSPAKRIRDLVRWSGEFAKEIEWWFSLKDCTAYPQNLALRKPICIELYEFAHYLGMLIKEINGVTHEVNELFMNAGRGAPLKGLDRSMLKIIRSWKDNLKVPRNRFAAHRFVRKSGQFFTLNEVLEAMQGLDWEILCQAHTDLEEIKQAVVSWHNDRVNNNHLVLAARLMKSR